MAEATMTPQGTAPETLAAIFAAARNVSLILTDLRGEDSRILEFSPGAEAIFGYRRSEVLGRPVAMLHLPEDVARFPEVIEAMRRDHDGFNGETTLVRKGGEHFPALFSTYPVWDAHGEMVGTVGVSLDITGRKRSEEQLRRQNETLEAMFGSIHVLMALMDREFGPWTKIIVPNRSSTG